MNRVLGYVLSPSVWIGDRPINRDGAIESKDIADVAFSTLVAGIQIEVSQDGVFTFDFEDSPIAPPLVAGDPNAFPDISGAILNMVRRLTIVNAHLACLYTAFSLQPNITPSPYPYPNHKSVIAPADLLSFEMTSGEAGAEHLNPLPWFIRRIILTETDAQYFRNVVGLGGIRGQMEARTRIAIPLSILEDSFVRLGQLLVRPEAKLDTLTELYLRGCKACEEHNYSLSIIFLWTVIENLINRHWEAWTDKNGQPKKTKRGMHFPASHKIKTLADAGVFTQPLFAALSTVLDARNEWLHSMNEPPIDVVWVALHVAESLLDAEGVEVRVTVIASVQW